MIEQTAYFKLTCGLYLLTSHFDGNDSGCIINTLQQVTSHPEQLSITINKNNFTQQIIDQSGAFSAMPLLSQTDITLIQNFGFCSSRDQNKFAGYHYKRDQNNIPYLTEQIAARFSCQVAKKMDVGSHIIYVGKVLEAEDLSAEEVMTYAYYHKIKKGITPPNAPSYQEKTNQKGWRCTICGYIYEEDTLPQDFICPVCGAPASVFEKI